MQLVMNARIVVTLEKEDVGKRELVSVSNFITV
jgi:hypothetical protein